MAEDLIDESVEKSLIQGIIDEIIGSPLNLLLVGIITFLIYKIFKKHKPSEPTPIEPELPKLKKDFTVQELKAFDGKQEDGRVLVAVNGNVYDVTKGKRFYGPGGPYAAFGGKDASRGLATFSVTANDNNDYDDLSDLSPAEMESVKEWEMQFKEKYDFVGRLLRPGEQPTSYSEDEEDEQNSSDKSGGEEKLATESNEKPEE